MIRQIIIAIALVILPVVVYALFAGRPGALAMRWLLIAALVMMIAAFGVWVEVGGAPPGATYVPAHLDHGQFIPGGFK